MLEIKILKFNLFQKMVPEDIKKNVRAVLMSKKGIALNRFLQDYKELICVPLKFRELGFSSLHDMMESIPDVARLVFNKKY